MPRGAREKTEDATYHIMCRGNGEELLFRNDYDKEKYLRLVRKYQMVYDFKVYAYCLMDTHCHMLLYSNGSDISTIMHHINQSYAQGHYNRRYKRRGHVFGDRFKSKIIDDNVYLYSAWGYIHNNPVDIIGFKNNVENYRYSSLGIYLGISSDDFGLVDVGYMSEMFDKDVILARNKMCKFVDGCNDIEFKEEFEFKSEKQQYRSEKSSKFRNVKLYEVIKFVADYLKCDEKLLFLKNKKIGLEMRSLSVFMFKSVFGMSDKDVARYIGNVTQSTVSRLLLKAIEIMQQGKHNMLLKDFVNAFS